VTWLMRPTASAIACRLHRVTFAPQRVDHVERKEDDRAVRAAVEAKVALAVPVVAFFGDQRFEQAALRHPAATR
jgi:hypothetical protein